MEFGKLEDISKVDWSLPADDPSNLNRFKSTDKSHLFIGGTAWGCEQWRGKFYPEELPREKFLSFYSQQFNCIELNTTHYRIPSEEVALGWVSAVSEDFKFCPKVYKEISHNRMGMIDREALKPWLEFLERIGTNLGPCFIQLHEKFSYADKMILFRFLENWPKEFKISFEFRHSTWFQNQRILPALSEYLYKKNMGLVITDVAGRRDVLHSSVSSPWTMLRLIGNSPDSSDEKRLEDWADRFKAWQALGVNEQFLFLHQSDDQYTIEFSQQAGRILSEKGFKDFPQIELIKRFDLFNPP